MPALAKWLRGLLALILILCGLTPALAATPSTLQLPATTTAYTAGQFMATSATGTSVVIPTFYLQSQQYQTLIARGRLQINDTTASSWNGQTITISFWDVAPTFAAGSGDRTTFNPSGTANYHGSLTCVMSTIDADGVYGDCSVTTGNAISFSAPNGLQVPWTATATTGSGTTGASKIVTFFPEFVQ